MDNLYMAISSPSGSTTYVAMASEIFKNKYEVFYGRWEYDCIREATNSYIEFHHVTQSCEACDARNACSACNASDTGKAFVSCETSKMDIVKEKALLNYIYTKACVNKTIRDVLPGLDPMSMFRVQLTGQSQQQLLLVGSSRDS